MKSELRAVITGAGSGLGRAIALDVARRGGRVVAADIDVGKARETADLVARAGAEAHPVRCDVADAADVQRLAARATELLGEVDLVANNAGVGVGGLFHEIPLADWQWIMGINLWGVIHGCQAFLPAMQARGRGYVINVASAAGLISSPGLCAYNVTKAGVIALSETLHAENKPSGVHVSVLCPTFFATNLLETARSPETRRERMHSMMQRLMARSRVQAADVARAAVDGVLRGDLYVLPMRDGRMFWRLKRAVPEHFHTVLGSRLTAWLTRA